MYTCMYVDTGTCVMHGYMSMYVWIVSMQIYGMCVFVYTHMWISSVWGICTYVCMWLCMCICVYACVCTGVYMQVMLYVYMFVCHCPQTLKNELSGTIAPFYYHNPRMAAIDERALHLPIVRKKLLESIVLKQKSIAFGSCPRKFNELIFKAPLCLGLNSVTPQGTPHRSAGGKTHSSSLSLLGVSLCSSWGPRTFHETTFQARVSTPQHRSAHSPWGKRTQYWFSRGRKTDPSFVSQRTKSLLDFLISSKEILPHCAFPTQRLRGLGSRGSPGWWLQDAWLREEEVRWVQESCQEQLHFLVLAKAKFPPTPLGNPLPAWYSWVTACAWPPQWEDLEGSKQTGHSWVQDRCHQ